jgi:Rod binding domain-containing protein
MPEVALPDASAAKDARSRADVAQQFEAVLVRQLLAVMRSTAKTGGLGSSSGASGQYLAMMDESMADQVAAGGGIGLARMFVGAMGGEADPPTVSPGLGVSFPQRNGTASAHAEQPLAPPPAGLMGATARLAQAAYHLAARDGGKQWAREGTLTPQDLSSPIATPADGGVARFSVLDAQGFRDNYKCNLYALEAARRAGFQVPLVARAQGWGFPTSNTITEDAADGQLRDGWADVVAPEHVQEVGRLLERGEAAVILSGGGDDGRHGHMAVVERIHSIKVGKDGRIQHIEFDGYEARVDGAQHLTRRSWNLYGHGQDERAARNGFGRIEMLTLRQARTGDPPEIPNNFRARASNLDSRLSSPAPRPIR